MGVREPRFRWTLTVTCSANRHMVSRTVVVAPNLLMAQQQAINITRTKALTDAAGIRWDRWTLMGRDRAGRPLRIVAIGGKDGTTWSEATQPVRRWGHGA